MSRVPPGHTLRLLLAVWGSGVRIPLAPLLDTLGEHTRTLGAELSAVGVRSGSSCSSPVSSTEGLLRRTSEMSRAGETGDRESRRWRLKYGLEFKVYSETAFSSARAWSIWS
jgi:hypothetical protein